MTTDDESRATHNEAVSKADITRIQKGWVVEGSDGAQIGRVFSVTHPYSGADIYLVTQNRRYLRTREIYIPLSAIARVSNGRVVLNVTKDDARSSDWSQPPRSAE